MDKKKLLNEHGISLVEVIAAIVILSIILMSIISLLPQMGLKNNQNEDKQTAVNLAALELEYWQSELGNDITFNSLTSPGKTFSFIDSADSLSFDANTITIKTAKTKSMPSKYSTIVYISRAPDLNTSPNKANQISIFIYKDNTILVTETHGYIIY